MEYPVERLPLLKSLLGDYSKNCLSEACVIACQHLLPSTHLMFRSFFDLGLSPEKAFVIGKCYSSSNKVIANMRRDGICVSHYSQLFQSDLGYDEQFSRYLSSFVENVKTEISTAEKPKVIIVIDDGGELLCLANKLLADEFTVIGVEQTTSGYKKLALSNLKFPVANVARSWAKLRYESPMIARSQTVRLLSYLEKYKGIVSKGLIVGNGVIGNNLHQSLQYYFHLDRYDVLPGKSTISNLEKHISDYDLIIGATGTRIFHDPRILNKKVILINASSSDREFPAEHIRLSLKGISNCHQDVSLGGTFLPNCGFPINFRGGDKDTVPLNEIQLTIGLLVLGMLQTLFKSKKKTGLIGLDISQQKRLLSFYLDLKDKQDVTEHASLESIAFT